MHLHYLCTANSHLCVTRTAREAPTGVGASMGPRGAYEGQGCMPVDGIDGMHTGRNAADRMPQAPA